MDIGIDLTRTSRFINKTEHFINRILTKEEQEDFYNLNEEHRPLFLAVHWASKEAIFKATQDKNYLTYSLKHLPSGKPYILNHPELKISISHEGDYVTAIVMAI